jgi:hypothetical protein
VTAQTLTPTQLVVNSAGLDLTATLATATVVLSTTTSISVALLQFVGVS